MIGKPLSFTNNKRRLPVFRGKEHSRCPLQRGCVVELLIVFKEDADPPNGFCDMIVPGIPALIVQLLLDFLKPFLRGAIHSALVGA